MSGAKTLRIEVVSDVVCPWCLIGSTRLTQALAARPEVKADVQWLPFLLDPSTPPEGADLRARLRAKYGVDPESMFGRVEAAAREVGVDLDFKRVTRAPNTLKAHTLLRRAGPRGTQGALSDALFRAYFLEGLDVGDDAVLADLATPHGFARDEALAVVRDAAALDETRREAEAMGANGIRAVPFFIFNDSFAVSGAQPAAVFAQCIAKALGEG